MTPVIFDAATFLILAFVLFAVSTTGRHIMSRAEIVQARDELLASIADVQEQLDSVEAPEDVDLTALTAVAQSLDDIVPDAPEVPDEQPVEDVPVEDVPVEDVPADEPADDAPVDQPS